MIDKKIDSMFNLLDETSNQVLKHQKNFEIIEEEFNNLKNRLEVSEMMNTLLAAFLLKSSDDFKNTLEQVLEESKKEKRVPEAFKEKISLLLSMASSHEAKEQNLPILKLLQGGKDESES